ncbi:MAG: family system-associated outer membrane protein [Rhodospirillales bacterium]|nr:family system-associated outer membrane protein [Rhodospirillales bacterium]
MPFERETARGGVRRKTCLAALILPATLLAASIAWAQDVVVTGEATARAPATIEAAGGEATPDTEVRGLEVRTSAALEEIVTDNARSVASGGQIVTVNGIAVATTPQAKSADVITRVTPSLSIVNRSSRTEGALTIAPSLERYAVNHDLDRFDTAVTGTNLYTLWHEHLAVATSASISRQVVTSQGVLTADGRATSTNQATLRTFTVTPTFTQNFHNFATGTVAAQVAETSSGVLSDATQTQITAALASGSDWARFVWNASLQATDVDQSGRSQGSQIVNGVTIPTGTANSTQRTASLVGKYALDRTFAVLSSFGYETLDNPTLASNKSGPIASIGIGITGTRSRLNLAYNYRYGGRFISTDGSYDITKRVQVKLSYNETITTSQQQAIGNVGGLSVTPQGGFTSNGQPFTPVTSPSGINGGVGNAAFHDQRGQLTVTGAFDRNSVSFGAQTDTQTTETTGFKSTTIALVATFARELTTVTTFNAAFNYIRTDQLLPISILDDSYDTSLGLAYLLGRGLTATATYSLLYRQSSAPGQNITENALTLGLRKSF